MNEMIERVARGIATADERNGGPPYEAVILNKHSREALFDRATEAIAALRDPDHDATSTVVKPGGDRTAVVETWNAIIDRILAP